MAAVALGATFVPFSSRTLGPLSTVPLPFVEFQRVVVGVLTILALAPAAGLITTNLGSINPVMNSITLTTQQVADLQAYLASLTGGTTTPTISLNKTTMSATAAQGTSPANDTFTVANGGQGTIDYTITDDVNWLTVSPTSGSTTGEANTITVTYNTDLLAVATYVATITVADANATNNPQTIAVSLTISAAGGGGSVSAGQALYAQSCTGCHPSPSALAPAASLITTNLGSLNPAMNSITLTDQQVADLQAYLASLTSPPDAEDSCPDDPAKTEPGACGCGIPDVDANGNGIPDCIELPTPPGPPLFWPFCGFGCSQAILACMAGLWGISLLQRRITQRRGSEN